MNRSENAICISVGDEAVHGIPGARRIKAGDLVKLDVTVEKDGYTATRHQREVGAGYFDAGNGSTYDDIVAHCCAAWNDFRLPSESGR